MFEFVFTGAEAISIHALREEGDLKPLVFKATS